MPSSARTVTVADVIAAAKRCAQRCHFDIEWKGPSTDFRGRRTNESWNFYCHHGEECEGYDTLPECLAFFEARSTPQDMTPAAMVGLPVDELP